MTPHDRTDPAFVLAETTENAVAARIAEALGLTPLEGFTRGLSWMDTTVDLVDGTVMGAFMAGDPDHPPRVWISGPRRAGLCISFATESPVVISFTHDHSNEDRDFFRKIDASIDGLLTFALQNAGDERALRWYRGEE